LRYAENRPYTVGETLEELADPAAGVVVLPTALDWTPKRVYDLSDDADLRMLYETVIREAMHAGELRTFLDPVLLSAMWQRLWGLPRAVRVGRAIPATGTQGCVVIARRASPLRWRSPVGCSPDSRLLMDRGAQRRWSSGVTGGLARLPCWRSVRVCMPMTPWPTR
jgi:hypothetical protein